MTAEVVNWPGITRLDLPADRIIEAAAQTDLKGVIVVGWDKDDDFYFASSYAGGPEVLWLLELARLKLIKIGVEGFDE